MAAKTNWVDRGPGDPKTASNTVSAAGLNALGTEVNSKAATTDLTTGLAGKQDVDADLTALAALTSPATKLAGIATGATANDTDANLKARANHTGGQAASTISDSTASGRTVVTGTATAGRNALEAASQRIMRPNGPRLGVLGDSLQSYGYSSTSGSLVASRGGVIWRRVEWLSRRRVQMTNPQQDPGDTIDDVLNTQLPALLASSPVPNACAIAIGRNDSASGMTGAALATWMGKLESVCTQLSNAGIVPILETLMPTGAAGLPSAPQTSNIARANAAILALGARKGYLVVDQYAAIVDPTGGIVAAYDYDHTHLTALGYAAVADAIITQNLLDLFPPVAASTIKDAAHPFDLLAGAGLSLTGTPTGFSIAGTGTSVTYVDPVGADGIAGRWAKITKVNGSTAVGAYRFTSTAGAITPGEVSRISGVAKMDGAWNADGTPANYLQISAEWRNGTTLVSTNPLVNRWDGLDPITFSEDCEAPSGVDGVRIVCYLTGTAVGDQNVYLGELSAINLTDMNI